MKYIVIKGSQWAGKAETIREVCRRLKPSVVRRLHVTPNGRAAMTHVDPTNEIGGGNYIITVRNKHILIVTGSPTVQRTRITSIIESVHQLNCKPEFAIIAAREFERLKDFATTKELEKFGQCIYQTKIWRIPSIRFNLTEEWNKRVSYLTAITLHNI